MSLVEQELLTLPEHMSSPLVFSGVRVTRCLVLYVSFFRSLFVLLYFFFWPFCCLFFLDIRILNHRYPICGPPLCFCIFFNSSLLWDVFIINSVEQLQTLPKTQSEIDISPFLKTQNPPLKNLRKGGSTNRVPMF